MLFESMQGQTPNLPRIAWRKSMREGGVAGGLAVGARTAAGAGTESAGLISLLHQRCRGPLSTRSPGTVPA